MRINCVSLGIVSTILVLSVNIVSVFGQDNEIMSSSESAVDTNVTDSGLTSNLTEVLNSLNFSCDIELNCFDNKNQVELVILPNSTSVIDTRKTGSCAPMGLGTNGLLLIPNINSSLSLDKLESFGFIVSRACYIVGGENLDGVWSVSPNVSIQQFFGQKNYSAPDGIILTIERSQ